MFESSIRPEQYFILKGGREIKNLYELANSLKSMDDETFRFHINEEKNDFSNWVRYVIKDEKLADNISKTTNRNRMIKEIEKSLFDKNEDEEIPEEIPMLIPKEQHKNDSELFNKLDEILAKEKELEKREEKIQEIEERIEQKLSEIPSEKKEAKFFSKEFIQGVLIGALIALIIFLIYLKFSVF